MKYIVFFDLLQVALGKVFHWFQGYRVPCQAPAKPEEVGIKLPGEEEETPDQSDAELAKHDLIQVIKISKIACI